ncbi:MAG: hypothetical protein CL398_12080 [Acidiferrobacteraceae bacterium]|nr:hypothetical protein [Acidiferrobacteraceae bacterium]
MTIHTKSKQKRVSNADRQLFRDAVATLPINSNKQHDKKEDDSHSENMYSEFVVNRSANAGILSTDGELFYRPGVQKNTLRNLKRGRIRPDAEIDLHGCKRGEALQYLHKFIQHSKDKKLMCVRIITGKGRSSPNFHSVIKESALNWLRNETIVLAYSMATYNDGGNGAYYVLLRV